jgi:hypothetical protein
MEHTLQILNVSQEESIAVQSIFKILILLGNRQLWYFIYLSKILTNIVFSKTIEKNTFNI